VSRFMISLKKFDAATAVWCPRQFFSNQESFELEHRPTSCGSFASKEVARRWCGTPL
jgi:hypothetical protein